MPHALGLAGRWQGRLAERRAGRRARGLARLVCGGLLALRAAAAEQAAPLEWVRPAGFAADREHLGLPVLTGLSHRVLYDPLPSEAEKTGRYESLRHGTYSHHPTFVRCGEWLIVQWTQHMADENGPGQRLLAKAGRIVADDSDIAWGGDETLSELCPAAHPVRRRRSVDDGAVADGVFASGGLEALEDGRLFLTVRLKVCDGWTDDVRYHDGAGLAAPVPEEHYRPGRGMQDGRRYFWDLYWHVGRYVQQVSLGPAGQLRPEGPMYRVGRPPPAALQVTPSLAKPLLALNEPYRSAEPLERAHQAFRDAYARCGRSPRYAPGTSKLAENGKNGLAHHTEFVRPDGRWVAVRDNLLDPTTYYAAVKRAADGVYPAAVKTSLFGTAMPVAGELPSGGVWFIGSNAPRTEAYLTLSRDGVRFDKTWSMLSLRRTCAPGVCKGDGGAQYFQAVTIGSNVWVVYSVVKEQVGLTRLPVALLERLAADDGQAADRAGPAVAR
jgi:hypothetical protein